ncbi:MAG: hypothetical protein E6R06_21540 [Mycobacterium sp.]|nr:MAG: hypothetical protein E6R06_21540 [Mycobacterium sp.]
MSGEDIGYYAMPVILSFDGVDAKVNKGLGAKLGLAGKKAGQDFGKNMADGMKSSESAMKAATDNYKKLADKQADASGKVRSAEAALKGLRELGANNSRIVAAEERLSKARRDEARATSEAHGALKELESAKKDVGSLDSGVGSLASKFGSLSDLAGAAGTALTSVGVVAAGAAVAGVAALGGAALVAGRHLYDLGAEFDDTFDNIRLKTGATGPLLDELEAATKRLATGVPVSIGEIGDVVAETSRALHLTGPELDEVAKRLSLLGSWGMQVDIRELGKAFRGFGVEAKDQAAAVDSLFVASQKTGMTIDELLASVVKGGPALRQFGIGFGEAAALATSLEEAGLDVDKTMAGLSKGLVTMAKDGETGRDALQGTIREVKALADAGNEAGAINLASKLFGAKAGAQFFAAIRSGALDLDALASSLDNTGDTILAAAADTEDWAERWDKFKNTAKVALEPLASTVFNLVNGELTDLADWVTDHQPEIVGFFFTVGDFALGAADKIVQFGATTIHMLAPMAAALEGFARAAGNVANLGGLKHNGVGDGLLASADALRDFAKSPDLIDGMASRMHTSIEGWRADLGNLGKQMVKATQFTTALGEATASIPDGKTIRISDNSPEVEKRLGELGIHIEEMPDGTVTVAADTEEGQAIIEAWRKSQSNDPLDIPLTADTDSIAAQIAALNDIAAINIPMQVGPSLLGPAADGPLIMPPGRAIGGIYDVWDEVASFANGKLPKQAMIQSPVGSSGLIQWAEPSTEGEAFIPLARSNRQRSQAIWAETGRRLGVLSSFDQGGLNPGASYVRQLIMSMYPQITDIGGYRPPDGYNEHSSGNAIDVMIPNWDTPEGKALGDAVASFALRNAEALGLSWVLWQQRSFSPGDYTGQQMPDRGDPNQNHLNHVHLFMNKLGGQLPTAPLIPGAGAVSARGFTGGVGASSGLGTYAAADPKQMREAQERVSDADARVREAELRQKELEADAKESQKESAQNAVDKAKREASDARADLAELAQGKFTPTKGGGKGPGAGGANAQLDPLKQLVSIFGGGLLETFGLNGSWLPDLTNLMPVKAAGAALDTFVPMLLGGDQSGGGSGGIGGLIPDAYIPPPDAPDGAHLTGPGGMPTTPGPVYNIDQSMQLNGATLGWDAEATFKQYNRNAKTHRLPS